MMTHYLLSFLKNYNFIVLLTSKFYQGLTNHDHANNFEFRSSLYLIVDLLLDFESYRAQELDCQLILNGFHLDPC